MHGSHRPADLVLRGGDLWTMDPARPRAQAVAIRDGAVVAVGDDAAMASWIGAESRVVELAGRSVTPGLVDGHCHLYGLGASLEAIDLRGVGSPEAAADQARAAAADRAPGEWISGRGWDQNRWPGQAFPHRRTLDAAVGDRPVAFRRVDGHALWASTAALRAAAITRETPDPPGGKILRDAKGEATGVLIDTAIDLVENRMPSPSATVRARRIRNAARLVASLGVTGVHEMGIDDDTVAVYRELARRGELPIRVVAYWAGDLNNAAQLASRAPDRHDPTARFELAGVKFFADGALGSRGARLAEPYLDDPNNLGLWLTEPADLVRVVEIARRQRWQVAIHAIGDAAVHAVLDAYQAAGQREPGVDARLRVEHAQLVAPGDVARFAGLSVIASMQPTHATSDMPWAEARVGATRIRGAYAWRTLLGAGARITAGSDFPVEEPSPLLGIYAAVTRQDAKGSPQGGWYPEERMTLDEAIRAFTSDAAYAVFDDQARGVIAPGMRADLTIFGRALTPDAELLTMPIAMTIVDGKVIHELRATP